MPEDNRLYIKVHNVVAGWVLIYGMDCWTSTKQVNRTGAARVARERQQVAA